MLQKYITAWGKVNTTKTVQISNTFTMTSSVFLCCESSLKQQQKINARRHINAHARFSSEALIQCALLIFCCQVAPGWGPPPCPQWWTQPFHGRSSAHGTLQAMAPSRSEPVGLQLWLTQVPSLIIRHTPHWGEAQRRLPAWARLLPQLYQRLHVVRNPDLLSQVASEN